MKEFLKMYEMLKKEQKKAIFTEEQIKELDVQCAWEKLMTDEEFYCAVRETVGKALYVAFNG